MWTSAHRATTIPGVDPGRPAPQALRVSMVLSTEQQPAGERLAFWREVVNRQFVPLEVRPMRAEPFHGRVRSARLGPMQVSEVTSSAQQVTRTPRLIARDSGDDYKVGVQLRGSCVLAQDGRDVRLVPGDFAVYDCSRPYSLAFDGAFRTLVLVLPRRLIRLRSAGPADISAVRVSGREGLGGLVSPFLRRLGAVTEDVEGVAGHRIAESVVDLLTTAVAERLDDTAADPESAQRALFLRISGFMEERLADPDLSPELIAAAHTVSVRYLHKLFALHGTTVCGWLRERRLEGCRRDLADRRLRHRNLGAVAARWGLHDPAHFSRLFKRAYGLAPSQYRAEAHGSPC